MAGIKHIKYIEPQYRCMSMRTIVCPYCGRKESDPTEYIGNYSQGEDISVQCGECGEEFIFIYDITIDYSSCCKECDFELAATGEGYNHYECKRCGHTKCVKE